MISRKFINRSIIFTFMILVGFSLAKSIYSGSILALSLAIVSLSAGIYFVYLLVKMKAELERNAE